MANNHKTPEELAREKIDLFLTNSGWDIVGRNEYNELLNACAIKEGLLKGNREADYLLFVGGKAIAVLEAKKAENKLNTEVAEQVQNYSKIVPDWYKMWQNPLPFVFMSNGQTLLFRDMRAEEIEYKELKKMLSPKELVKMLDIKEPYASLPALPKGLRECQINAVANLELSFKKNKNKALICLATGAGKTFTACTIVYRLLTYTPIRKVLFLVDRNNLGAQAQGEFKNYSLTENNTKFDTIYQVSRLKNIDEAKSSNVVISTIQRLFATLTGQSLESINDDEESFDGAQSEVISLENSTKTLAPDFFDLIIIDECHRSIYGKWQEVLKYFHSAKVIGLTATPTPEAYAFFDKNKVADYTFEDSVKDGVNVAPIIYRIKTQITQEGGAIEINDEVEKTSKITQETQTIKSKERTEYSSTELNRQVVNLAQIRLIITRFKEIIYSTLYKDREPNFAYIPKTLIFAENDRHADNIINQIKEVFAPEFKNGLPENFVQKITCKAGNSNELIRQFRNNVEFRIAVTVTLVATGTDVKPLECVIFMRDVSSAVLYTQMKGRGCRYIDDEKLKQATPNATSKDHFYIIDAIGVTEHEKKIPNINDKNQKEPFPNLARLFELLSHGNLQDEYITLLFNRLSKCANKGDKEELQRFTIIAGFSLHSFLEVLSDKIKNFPPFNDINEANQERKEALNPLLTNTIAKKQILEINAGFIKTIDTADIVISEGFSKEEAKSYIESFEQYLDENKDKIEALKIIYNAQNITITHNMLADLQNQILTFNPDFKTSRIWENYKILNEGKGIESLKKDELTALTNLISLVRFAYKQTSTLKPIVRGYLSGFNLYAGQAQRPLNPEQTELLSVIAKYIAQNGSLNLKELKPLGDNYRLGIINIFGDQANQELEKLAKFIIKEAA